EVKRGVGTPKSLVTRLAQRFGATPEHAALIAALSRALGLWETQAASTASPPGEWVVSDVSRALFEAWRRGGAWDEARPEPEVLRAAPEQRDPSPATSLRAAVL